MNRLHHLRDTLWKNIQDNKSYSDLEFLLLDYNSNDGLHDYIKSNLFKYVKSGRLRYYRTTDPIRYTLSHSRNLAFKLASGDILCNIDADNFTGEGFADYVNSEFHKNVNIFLSTHNQTTNVRNDVLGRICVRKADFYSVGGYDERMLFYGFDDYDFVNRLEKFGIRKALIDKPEFLNAIKHSNSQRLSNILDVGDLHELYIKYVSPSQSNLIFLFKDGSCFLGSMINTTSYYATNSPQTSTTSDYVFSILEDSWTSYKWAKIGQTLSLNSDDNREILKFIDLNKMIVVDKTTDPYYKITNDRLQEDAIFFLHQVSNRIIMEKNLARNHSKVNEGVFGDVKNLTLMS